MTSLPGPRFAPLQSARVLLDPYAWQRELRAKYGPIVRVPTMNGVVVMVFSPELAKTVFTTEPEAYSTFAPWVLGSVLDRTSLLVSDGERHKRDRKLLTPPFHGARMRAYGADMRRFSRERFGAWQPGQVVRMHDVTAAITLDVILAAVFGVTEERELEEGRRMLTEAVLSVSPWVLFFPKILQTPLIPSWRRQLELRDRFYRWLSDRIADRRVRAEGDDVLGLMLAARYDDGRCMNEIEISAQLVTLLLAGHETTAIALAWATYWLLRDPARLDRLRAEIDSLGASRTPGAPSPGPEPEPEAINKLPYLSAVCDETLRLYPVATEVVRTLRRPLELGGAIIPAGDSVGVGIAAIHEDPALYPRPERFEPERFLERKYSPFEHLPFGGGHRRCIGAAFALYEMKLVLATLMSEWDLELATPREEVPARRSVTMGPKHGVEIRVRGRRKTVAAEVRSGATLLHE